MAIQNKKKKHQDMHVNTYNVRYSKPQQKHRLGTVSKILLWGVGGLNRFYVATILILPWYTQDICSVRVKGSSRGGGGGVQTSYI